MSDLIRVYAKDILSELNRSALEGPLKRATRRIIIQGGAFGVAALLFWAAALLIGPAHTSVSLVFLMLSFGLTWAMLQSAGSQIALGSSLSKDTQ